MSTHDKNHKNADRHVLIVLTSHGELGDTGESTGFHLAELTHVIDTFDARDIPYTLASVDGGRPPIDAKDESDDINAKYLHDDAWMERLAKTTAIADVDPSQYAAIYFPGGHGTMWDLPDNEAVQNAVRTIAEKDGLVSSICHGPAAFVNVRLSNGDPFVKGRHMTCFSDSEERAADKADVVPFLLESRLEERGATVTPADDGEAKVVTDGNFLTGQNPPSAKPLGEAIVQALMQMVPA